MKVMHFLQILITVAVFGVVQAQHKAILLDSYQNKKQKSEVAPQQPKTNFWRRYFNAKSVAPKPTLAQRFQSFKNYFFAPKPQVAVQPRVVQENPLLKQLEMARAERNMAFKQLTKERTSEAYKNFREKSRMYDAQMYDILDLGQPERLNQELERLYRSRR